MRIPGWAHAAGSGATRSGVAVRWGRIPHSPPTGPAQAGPSAYPGSVRPLASLEAVAARCHTGRMPISRAVFAGALFAVAVAASGCAQSTPAPSSPVTSSAATTPASTPADTPVIAPVTRAVGDLEGETVDLVVGQVLNITTGDLAVESYSGTVADTAVAEFIAGRDDGSAIFNPGVKALAAGTTTVVLANADGGIQDVTFTVEVAQ